MIRFRPVTQSDFEHALDMASLEHPALRERDAEARRSARISDLAVGTPDERASGNVEHPAERLARIYFDEPPAEWQVADDLQPGVQQAPVELLRSVADELRISPQMTVSDLRRLRRAFALANHPDRVDPSNRADATERMTVANTIIDKAMKERQTSRLSRWMSRATDWTKRG
ncbi:MAG: hypothetical protein AB7K67_15470 [Hyphomicrobiaceae bacterium]